MLCECRANKKAGKLVPRPGFRLAQMLAHLPRPLKSPTVPAVAPTAVPVPITVTTPIPTMTIPPVITPPPSGPKPEVQTRWRHCHCRRTVYRGRRVISRWGRIIYGWRRLITGRGLAYGHSGQRKTKTKTPSDSRLRSCDGSEQNCTDQK